MIKFGKIISEAGFDQEDFKNLAKISVPLFDRKGRGISEDSFCFHGKLFAKNLESKKKFRGLLDNLSKEDINHLTITGKLSDDVLILYTSTHVLPHFFLLF